MTGDTAAVRIRTCQAQDEAFVVELGQRAFAPYSRSARDARATMQTMLADRRARAAIAEIGKDRVGFVIVNVQRLAGFYGPIERPAIAHVDAIAVDPNRQRHGVGVILMAWAETFSRTSGAMTMSLRTAVGNGAARRLFRASGFYELADLGAFYARGQHGIALFKPL